MFEILGCLLAGFENFNFEECINSMSFENFNKENQEKEMGEVPPDIYTPQPSTFVNPSPTPHPPSFVTPSATPQPSPSVVPSPTPQPPPIVASSSTLGFFPYTIPSPTTQPSPLVPSRFTPQLNPSVICSPTPQAVPFVIQSPTPNPPPIVIPSPSHVVSSMVSRVKDNPRKMIIPPRLSPYVLGSTSKRSRPNPQYSFTAEEDKILDKFWKSYHKKVPELD